MKIPTTDRSFDWSFLSTTGWKYEQLVDCTSRVYADQSSHNGRLYKPSLRSSTMNWSIISKTDHNLRQLLMVDYGQLIDLTDIWSNSHDRLPIHDMLVGKSDPQNWLQSNQVKRTPQQSINEFIIQKLNPLLVVDFRLISAFLYV